MNLRPRRRSTIDFSAQFELLETRCLLTAPIAIDDAIAVTQNETRDVEYILANDSDPDGDAISILSTTDPEHGTLATVGGRLQYTADASYTGDDSFDYVVQDSGGSTASGTVHVSVNEAVDITAARAQILAGVNSPFPNPTQPNKLLVYGPTAFSLLNATGEDSTHSYFAGATLGAGRVIATNDAQWLETGRFSSDANMPGFVLNGIDWLGNQDSSDPARKNIKVVTYNSQADADWLSAQGYTNVVNATWTNLATELGNADVLYAGWLGSNPTAANIQIVEDYVKGGGGLFVADYGGGYIWWWNKPVEDAPGNLLLRDAGIFFAAHVNYDASNPIPVEAATGQTSGYLLLDILDGTETVDAATEAVAYNTLAKALDSLPAEDSMRSALNAAFRQHRFGQVQATPASPKSTEQHKAQLTAEASWLQTLPLDEVPAHPTAEAVYGDIPDGVTLSDNQTFPVDVTKTGLLATGAYVVPGEIATIQVPASLVDLGYKFRINSHVDNISSRGSWDRLPYGVSRSFDIDATTVQVVNAFGGAIYLEIPGQAAGTAPTLGDTDLIITGAIEAPTFVLGKMTDAAWETERLKPAPNAELISDHVAIAVPSSWIRNLDNPTALMTYWDTVASFQDWVGATESYRTGPERFNVDVQISVGLLHAGYPIQGPTWASEELVDLEYLNANGNWGYFHELGHERQRNNVLGYGYNSAFTFDGDVEVTVNIFANAALENRVPNSPTGGWGYSVHPDLVLQRAATTVADAGAPNFEDKDPYPFYFELADGPWGWQGYRDVFATYIDDYANASDELPTDNTDEKDQWLIRWSETTGFDMTRFMVTNWGLEVTQGAIDHVAGLNLPDWMPLIGQDDVFAYHTGESVTFNVLDNDLTLDGVSAVDSFTTVNTGTLVDNGSGSFTFTPAINQIGDTTITYVVSNVTGQTSTQTVTIGEPKPFAWWKLDETTGTVAADSSGNGSDGTIEGAAWTAGTRAGALQFDGTNDKITFGTAPSLNGKTDFTVAGWVKTTATSNGVIIQQRNGGFNGQYQLRVKNDGTLGFYVYGNSGYQFNFATTETINDGEWHHVAAVRSGEDGLLYIDGSQVASASGTVRDLAGSIGVGVGADIRDDHSYFAGSMDDLRIYAIALNETEIGNIAGNKPPELAIIGDQSVDEHQSLTFTVTATDPEADALTFTLDAGAPVGASLHPTTGVFTWSPTESQGPDVYDVTIRVTDDGDPAEDDFETIQIIVAEVNQAPVMDTIDDQTIDSGSELAFTAVATDSDSPTNTLTYTLDAGAPGEANIDPASGVFIWTPSAAGTFNVTVRVTDDAGTPLSDFETFTITVDEVVSPGSLDIDDDSSMSALSDGILAIRFLAGFTGDSLTNGAANQNGSRLASAEIVSYLNPLRTTMLDVDDDGQASPLTDGILVIRHLAGFRGLSLINGAVSETGLRTTPEAITQFLSQFDGSGTASGPIAFMPRPATNQSNKLDPSVVKRVVVETPDEPITDTTILPTKSAVPTSASRWALPGEHDESRDRFFTWESGGDLAQLLQTDLQQSPLA